MKVSKRSGRPPKHSGVVNEEILLNREKVSRDLGYPCPKWIQFCRYFLSKRCKVCLYEAKLTRSKYVDVILNGRQVKVRFSNHKPIQSRELAKDCDFFVGVTHTGIRTTEDAIKFVERKLFLEDTQKPT